MSKTKETTTISIPREMRQRIEQFLSTRLGYYTVSEYVRDAIREKIERDEYKLQHFEAKEKERGEEDELE